eukprot:TRINITY_DN586_c0_g1_i2.p1 TRINITY_DN586_c0_g1~~TRINITY_DN586_c0_g1_i2.p1  ORF type:complete len:373 (+),score=37.71 TRINITY_DN586_c0_g1_i2:66-1184(+)
MCIRDRYITDNIDRPNKRAQALIIRDGEPCGLSTSLYTGDESNLKYTAIDRNGFYLKKSYHHIVLPLTQGFKNGEIYICIVNNVGLSYQGNSEYQFTYLLKATYSEKRPCANKCGGNGACDNVGVCICSSDNFADEDCSANVNLIQTGQEIFATIGPTRWMYFKASSPKGSPIITLKKPDSVLMRVSFKIPGEGGIWMPNLQEGTIIVQNSAQSWKADKSTFLIGVFNPTELAVDFNLKAVSDETGGGLYFALIVLVGFVGAAICVSILAIVCLRRFVSRNSIRIPQPSATEENERESIKKAMDTYCPISEFSTFEMVFSQTNCVICLEDFEKVSKCRQISLCSHIFHSHCIDAWMKQNSNCPVCKLSLIHI